MLQQRFYSMFSNYTHANILIQSTEVVQVVVGGTTTYVSKYAAFLPLWKDALQKRNIILFQLLWIDEESCKLKQYLYFYFCILFLHAKQISGCHTHGAYIKGIMHVSYAKNCMIY